MTATLEALAELERRSREAKETARAVLAGMLRSLSRKSFSREVLLTPRVSGSLEPPWLRGE